MKHQHSQAVLRILLGMTFSLFALALIIGSGGQSARAQDAPPPKGVAPEPVAGEYAPGELLVKFADNADSRAMSAVMAQYEASFIRNLYQNPVQLWQVAEGKELEIVEQLNADPSVEYAEPNYIYHAFDVPAVPAVLDPDVVPNDPSYGSQWAVPIMNLPQAWDISTGANTVNIAIIDSGIDLSHPDLAGKLGAGYDFVDNDANPSDLNGHGTHVAGIAAAAANNNTGIAGVCWNCRIMPVRALNATGSGSNEQITNAINWAYQNGADVINLSLGGTAYSASMQGAVNSATSNGTLVIAAIGNCRSISESCPVANPTNYPAAYNNVLAVAATAPDDTYSYYSQYGSHCDISAPGGEMSYLHDTAGIYSSMPTYSVFLESQYGYNLNYDFLHGTSQASPQVAGVAGLLFSVDPGLTPAEVEAALTSTATDLGSAGWDSTYGYGRVDAYAALASVAELGTPTLSAISNADGDGTYMVDWSDVSGATSYTLQEDDNAGFNSPQVYSGLTSSHRQITGQTPGTWYYRVRAADSSSTSDWSVTRTVTIKPQAPTLDPISNPSNTDAYTLTWTTQVGATSYVVQQSGTASFDSPVVRYDGSLTSYEMTGQREGTWYYRVLASNSAGNSGWSNSQSTTVDPLPYDIPVLDPIIKTDPEKDYTVSWYSVDGATGYILEESSDPYFVNKQTIASGASLSYSVTDQDSGTWYYRVRAEGSLGMGAWSITRSAFVGAEVYLPAVIVDHANPVDDLHFDFDSTLEGWQGYNGDWTATSGVVQSHGNTEEWNTFGYPVEFSDLIIEARIYRSSNYTSNPNYIMLRGEPDPLSYDGDWYNYIGFYYTPSGYFSVWEIFYGYDINVVDWTPTSAINTGNAWNTIKVTAIGDNYTFYINDIPVWSDTYWGPSSGYVGIGFYRSDIATDNTVQIDWVDIQTQ